MLAQFARWPARLAIMALVFTSYANVSDAQETNSGTWVALFDGKSLDGWEKAWEASGKEGSDWKVHDGAIVGTGSPSMLVYTKKAYTNFRYRAEIKINDGGNSGLYFRAKRNPTFSDGYEAQIDSTHKDIIRTGSIYGLCHVYQQHVKPDTWFQYEIQVQDDVWRKKNTTKIKVTLDGNELYEYLDFEQPFKDGYFAFQQHDPGSTVSIRKVEVMELPGLPAK